MTELPILVLKIILPLNPSTAEWAQSFWATENAIRPEELLDVIKA